MTKEDTAEAVDASDLAMLARPVCGSTMSTLQEANLRSRYVRDFANLDLAHISRKDAMQYSIHGTAKQIGDKRPPSVRTLRRWIKSTFIPMPRGITECQLRSPDRHERLSVFPRFHTAHIRLGKYREPTNG